MKILPLKKNRGFTLAELLMAILIFGMIVTGLAAIYGTSHRHLLNNYRQNVLKDDLSLALKQVLQDTSSATRIDLPGFGSKVNTLLGAVNIAPDGFYPIYDNVQPTWFYYCLSDIMQDCERPKCLWRHDGVWTGSLPTQWGPPAVSCGSGNNARRLLQDVVDDPSEKLFKRSGESNTMDITIKIQRLPAPTEKTYYASRPIVAAASTTVTLNISARDGAP